MRSASLARGILLTVLVVVAARAAEPPVPQPQGYVTDLAGVISPDARQRMTSTIQALKDKAGSEIAVLTIPTTDPLDDFTYAMRVADAWKVGRKAQDTGVLIVATQDRKRILTGYGGRGACPTASRQIQIANGPRSRPGRLGDGLGAASPRSPSRSWARRAGAARRAHGGELSPLAMLAAPAAGVLPRLAEQALGRGTAATTTGAFRAVGDAEAVSAFPAASAARGGFDGFGGGASAAVAQAGAGNQGGRCQ